MYRVFLSLFLPYESDDNVNLIKKVLCVNISLPEQLKYTLYPIYKKTRKSIIDLTQDFKRSCM